MTISSYKIEELSENDSFELKKTISEEEVDRFAELSGDVSLLHMDNEFAKQRGFKKRVVHGALINSYISRVIGVYLPGKNSLIHSLKLTFRAPTYINDTIKIIILINHISVAAKTLDLKVRVLNNISSLLLVKGSVQVGFTESLHRNSNGSY